jgi:peptidyl-prolyl cis-trans isomerase D
MEKARPLARKAAEEVAERLRKAGGVLKESTVEGYRVVPTPPIPRQQSSLIPGRFGMEQPEDTPIPDVPQAGEAFRDAYFSLQAGTVATAPNRPETVYYVLTLDRREPATFATLYAPNGDEFRYKMFAREQAGRQLLDDWMGWLRHQAGLKPDWDPADEAKGELPTRQG